MGQQTSTLTESGEWSNAYGEGFVFAFLQDSWSPSDKAAMKKAFVAASDLPNKIKAAVQKTSGQKVVDGVYFLDQPAMTMAMNSIDGLAETGASQENISGSGTASAITLDFFEQVLAPLDGDVALLQDWLTTQMGKIQTQVENNTAVSDFGTIVVLVALMPDLDIPVTTVLYLYADKAVSEQFTQFLCVSTESYSYNIDYTQVAYSYDPS